MKILDDLILALNFEAGVRDIRQGVFHTGVLTRNCGLAATLPRDALRQEPPMVKEPGFLLDKTPLELAQLAYSQSILEAAIGMATINSLLEIDANGCIELNADCIHPPQSKVGFHSVLPARSRYGRTALYERYRQKTPPTSASPG